MTSGLERRLGLSDAVVVGLGAMIGAGVFVAFAPAADRAGSLVWLALAVAAVVAVCNALSSSRLAVAYPAAGGTYVYGRELLGPLPGFLAGWGFVVGKTASCAAMALTAGLYLWPERAHEVAAVAVLALTVLSVLGVQRTATASKVLVGIVLTVLAVYVVLAWAGSGADAEVAGGVAVPGVDDGPWHTRLLGVLGGAGFCFFAFAGYARIATLGGEVRDPSRTLPRAIVTAIGAVIVVYTLVLTATVYVLGVGGVAAGDAPVLEAAEQIDSGLLAPVVRTAAGLAALGALLAGVLGVSRTTMAMAGDRHLPTRLASVHPRTRTPYVAEISVGLVVAVIVLAADVREAIGFSSFAVLVYYLVANVAALRLDAARRRLPVWIPVLGAIGCVVVAGSLPWTSVVSGLVVFAIGGVVYLATRRRAVPPGVISTA